MHLSIIIPCFNEESRLGPSLERIRGFLAPKPFDREVIVVNDGSSDGTSALAARQTDSFRSSGVDLRVIENPGNRGKGYSVRNGVMESKGQVVLFTDADLSTPIEEADKLIAPIERDDYDIVIASRALDDSIIPVRQSLMREHAGRTFNLIMRAIVGLPYKDTQCGFKAFRRDRVRAVFERQRLDGFGFDAEVLFIANRQGLRLLEVPVVWRHVEASKVRLFTDSRRMFTDLIKIRWNAAQGRYD